MLYFGNYAVDDILSLLPPTETFWTDLTAATETQRARASVLTIKRSRTEGGVPRAGHGPENCKVAGYVLTVYQIRAKVVAV